MEFKEVKKSPMGMILESLGNNRRSLKESVFDDSTHAMAKEHLEKMGYSDIEHQDEDNENQYYYGHDKPNDSGNHFQMDKDTGDMYHTVLGRKHPNFIGNVYKQK